MGVSSMASYIQHIGSGGANPQNEHPTSQSSGRDRCVHAVNEEQ
jgi:hypothetical protein